MTNIQSAARTRLTTTGAKQDDVFGTMRELRTTMMVAVAAAAVAWLHEQASDENTFNHLDDLRRQ